MKNTGIIIRLIDVAFIILFGFVIISRLRLSEIDLPSKTKPPKEHTQKHIVQIKIMKNTKNNSDIFILIDEDGKELGYFNNAYDMEEDLQKMKEKDKINKKELVVLIEPGPNSIIQHTVDVLDLCRRNNIKKNINYASLEL